MCKRLTKRHMLPESVVNRLEVLVVNALVVALSSSAFMTKQEVPIFVIICLFQTFTDKGNSAEGSLNLSSSVSAESWRLCCCLSLFLTQTGTIVSLDSES